MTPNALRRWSHRTPALVTQIFNVKHAKAALDREEARLREMLESEPGTPPDELVGVPAEVIAAAIAHPAIAAALRGPAAFNEFLDEGYEA